VTLQKSLTVTTFFLFSDIKNEINIFLS
jgi:hypothetical protein